MKLGLKLYTCNLNLLDKYKDLFDFFEVLIEADFDVSKLKHYSKEITIHAAHSSFGFDLSDPKKEKLNKEILDKAKEAADIVNSKYIIVHPGHNKNENSEKVMLNFLKDNFDKRFVFENSINNEDQICLFSTPKEIKRLLDKFDIKMCLDFAHATCSANFLGKDVKKFIKDFLKLKPEYFHVSGISLDAKRDMHKHLFEVENDYEYLKWINKNKYICLETRHQITNNKDFLLKDIGLMKSIIGK